MSKPLEQMSVEELSQYMKKHQDNDVEWTKAYKLFAEKSDWQGIAEGATYKEQKQFVEKFLTQVLG